MDKNENQDIDVKKPFGLKWMLLALAAVIVLSITLIILNRNEENNKQPSTTVEQKQTGKLSLSPATLTRQVGDTFTVDVWSDSSDEGVNAIQVNLNYPADKLEILDVSSEDSAFDIEAELFKEPGLIRIGRGHLGSLTGPQLVAKLTFKALIPADSAEITFADGTALVGAQNYQDILGDMQGGIFRIQEAE